jgi:hypothetical protein
MKYFCSLKTLIFIDNDWKEEEGVTFEIARPGLNIAWIYVYFYLTTDSSAIKQTILVFNMTFQ